MAVNIHTYADPEEVAATFALDFANSLPVEGPVSLALSGGSTPKILFRHWATHYQNQINWRQIHLYWGDERCVPPDHADSNYRMTKELLLDHIDIPVANIHRIQGELDPADEALRYGELIAHNLPAENGWPVFDWILLGMGGDGHTASIFPDSIGLLESESVCATATHPDSGQIRVSLTGKVLNAARRVSFLVTGASKSAVLRDILKQTGDYQAYPASYISPTGELDWYLDQAAASQV